MQYIILSKDYYEFTDEKAKYFNLQELDDNQVFTKILYFLSKEDKAKMKDFVGLFEDKLSRKQVRTRVDKLVTKKMLKQEGEGSSSIYEVGENYVKEMEVVFQALEIGMKEIEKTKKRPVNC